MRESLLFLTKRFLPNAVRARTILAYQRSVHFLRYGDAHFPRTIALEISVFCNRTCHYCPNSTNETPKIFMTDEMFEVALNRMSEIGWSGPVDYNFYNEPMADKRLTDFVKRTKARLPRSLPRVVTNGDYLTERLAQDLIDAGVVNFSISRHYPDTAAWDKKIAALRAKFDKYITLHIIWPRSDLSNRGGTVEIKDYKPIETCDAPAVTLNILHNGDVILCCCDYNRKYPYGNIAKQGLLDIWKSGEFQRQRQNVRDGKPELDICKACFGKA